jgi:ABC-type arginine/histidine transport system permease subunit
MGFARISLHAPVRGTSWVVVQFFRNAPWLVLLFFVMFLMPFEVRVRGVTDPVPDWIKATLGLALPIMANVAEIVRGAVQSIPTCAVGGGALARLLAAADAVEDHPAAMRETDVAAVDELVRDPDDGDHAGFDRGR